MYMQHEALARAQMSERLGEAQQLRRGQHLVAARRLSRKAEKAAQKEEREKLAKVVFLKKGSTAKLVKVTTGISDDTYMEIKSGVEPGDEVISGSYSAISRKLKEGAKVTYDKEVSK